MEMPYRGKAWKNPVDFPTPYHNTWKSREKSSTFPHSHKTFSLRSLKCGKTNITYPEGIQLLLHRSYILLIEQVACVFPHSNNLRLLLFYEFKNEIKKQKINLALALMPERY